MSYYPVVLLVLCHFIGITYLYDLSVKLMKKTIKPLTRSLIVSFVYLFPFALLKILLIIPHWFFLFVFFMRFLAALAQEKLGASNQTISKDRFWASILQHLILLGGIYLLYELRRPGDFIILQTHNTYFFRWATLVLINIKPANETVSNFLEHFIGNLVTDDSESLAPVRIITPYGKVIGVMERLFALIFISSKQWIGFGFLLAAKEFSHSKKVRETEKFNEYSFVGTMFSLLLSIFSYYFVFEILK